jgi:hypothetical protein
VLVTSDEWRVTSCVKGLRSLVRRIKRQNC